MPRKKYPLKTKLNEDSTIDYSISNRINRVINNSLSNDFGSFSISIESEDKKDYNAHSKTSSHNNERKSSPFFYKKENKKLIIDKKNNNDKCKKDIKCILKRKRKNNSNEKIKYDEPIKRVNNHKKNLNTIKEIDICYQKLNDLFLKYSFTEISKILIELFNNIDKNENDNNELFQKIKNIASKLNKGTITMICLSILSSKIPMINNINISDKNNKRKNNSYKNEKKEDILNKRKKKNNLMLDLNKGKNVNNKTINKEMNYSTEEIYDYNDDDNSEFLSLKEERKSIKYYEYKRNRGLKIEIVNSFRNMPIKKYLLYKHYYNDNKIIHCFNSKTAIPRWSSTLFCLKNSRGCKAKCIVKSNCNRVKVIGEHNHSNGISHMIFYQNFPFLKNKEWKHIQIIKEKEKKIIICQS